MRAGNIFYFCRVGASQVPLFAETHDVRLGFKPVATEIARGHSTHTSDRRYICILHASSREEKQTYH